RLAGPDQETVATDPRGDERLASGQERGAGALRGRTAARRDLARRHHPAHRPRLLVEGPDEDGEEGIRRWNEQALQLVALGEPEAGQPLARRVAVLQDPAEDAQPGARGFRIVPRLDDVAEQDDAPRGARFVHAGRLTGRVVAVKS